MQCLPSELMVKRFRMSLLINIWECIWTTNWPEPLTLRWHIKKDSVVSISWGDWDILDLSRLWRQYAVVCWGSDIRISDAYRLNKLIKKVSSVLETTLAKLSVILCGSHPLNGIVGAQESTFSRRLIPPRCKERYFRNVFLLRLGCTTTPNVNMCRIVRVCMYSYG